MVIGVGDDALVDAAGLERRGEPHSEHVLALAPRRHDGARGAASPFRRVPNASGAHARGVVCARELSNQASGGGTIDDQIRATVRRTTSGSGDRFALWKKLWHEQ